MNYCKIAFESNYYSKTIVGFCRNFLEWILQHKNIYKKIWNFSLNYPTDQVDFNKI